MIYITRHGQTELNKKNILQGRSDHPLNDEGRRQAAALHDSFAKNNITFLYVYSSPLIRAAETAKIISGCSSIITDERLTEMDYGPYEGTDLTNLPPEIVYFFSDFVNHPAPEGMEPLNDIVSRAGSFIESIKEEALKGNILISTHAIAMKGVLEYLTPDSGGSYWAKNIGNCDIYAADVIDGSYTVPVLVDDGKDRWEGSADGGR